jgi:hypothetical protein
MIIVDSRKELAKQSVLLESHEAELNRIDTALVGAARDGTRLPSPSSIFGALSDASIVCTEVIDTYRSEPIPANVRTSLLRLHCVMTDLSASLNLYSVLSASKLH